jgi:beta-galactosidase
MEISSRESSPSVITHCHVPRTTLLARTWILWCLAGALAFSPLVFGQQEKPTPSLMLGSAWYPEQWPESRWPVDIELMQKAHLHVVRVAEFAWTALEPQEGMYQLDWLERAVNLAGQHGMSVIIGTPSGGPPVWMATKYPDIMVTESSGKRDTGATRNRGNWSSERYRRFVRDIDEKLAARFAHNPYVIGWQIDNEYNKASYDADAQAAFHVWLQHHYRTINSLNAAWTTAYDNQTFSAWDEVPFVEGTSENNPGLWLDSKRFISETLRDFQKVQIDAIRKYAGPNQKITTNMMGWFDLYDHYTVAQDLDIIGWDNPQVLGTFEPIRNGAAHDLMRGLKDSNYWVLESTAGPRGGGNASVMLDKGAMRAAIWSYIGHGSDLVSYWQWRDALNGGEQSHGGIVDVDGEPDPIYDEYRQTAIEFEKASSALQGTHVSSEVAILHSYPSRWTINWQKMNPSYDAIDNLMSFYRPLHELGYSIDIVPPDRNLSSYKLVVAPGLNVLTQAEADNLKSYALHGGHLVLGQRSAMKDEHGSRWPQRQPGPLRDLLGARVEQYTALNEPVMTTGLWGESKGELFAEQLKVEARDVKVLQTYHAPLSWLDGQPAAVSRKVGTGSISYIGAWLDPSGMKRAAEWMLHESALEPDTFQVPSGVEVYRRVRQKSKIFIVENLSRETKDIALPSPMMNVLSGQSVSAVKLNAYGVAVLTKTD